MIAVLLGLVMAAPVPSVGGSPPAADVGVTVMADPSPAQPGQMITYRVRLRNQGPGVAQAPVLIVYMPKKVDILAVSVRECTPPEGNRIVCSSADAKPMNTGEVVVTAVVRDGAQGALRARARIASPTADPNPSDNTAELSTPITTGADLAVRLSTPVRSVHPGDRVTVIANVDNRGPRTAHGAYLLFDSSQLRYVEAQGGRCRRQEALIGCDLGRLARGDRVRLRLTLHVADHVRSVSGEAVVFAEGVGDPRERNNVAHLRLPVTSDHVEVRTLPLTGASVPWGWAFSLLGLGIIAIACSQVRPGIAVLAARLRRDVSWRFAGG